MIPLALILFGGSISLALIALVFAICRVGGEASRREEAAIKHVDLVI